MVNEVTAWDAEATSSPTLLACWALTLVACTHSRPSAVGADSSDAKRTQGEVAQSNSAAEPEAFFHPLIDAVAKLGGLEPLTSVCANGGAEEVRLWGGFGPYAPDVRGWILRGGQNTVLEMRHFPGSTHFDREPHTPPNTIVSKARVETTVRKLPRSEVLQDVQLDIAAYLARRPRCPSNLGADGYGWMIESCVRTEYSIFQYNPDCGGDRLIVGVTGDGAK